MPGSIDTNPLAHNLPGRFFGFCNYIGDSAILYSRGGNFTLSLKSQAKTLSIHNIDDNIFTLRYNSHCSAHCMEYGCNDSCCAYGCSADIAEIDRVLAYKDELEKRLGISAARWFTGDVIADVDYPSKYYRRTSVLNGHCIFHNINARGCLLHSMALEKGIDPHLIKPMICFLFPVTWEWDYLHISDFLDELCYKQDGDFVLDSIMPELRYYLGDEMADELEHIRANLSEGIKKPAE